MNKHLYRIVFNKRRGQLMVVAETAGSQGKGAAGETGPGAAAGGLVHERLPQAAWRPLCLAVLAALGTAMALPAQAQIVADPSAPGGQRPTVLVTNSGVAQVDIATPSAAGVSRNTYTQFDIDSRGAILNNSRTDTQTQLGGWVHGNGNLAGGSARIILNEVNSSNPSLLGGYVEVAGQRAEVVIANPAGLKIDGGGFINASRVTLTTGTPLINGGNLEGYAVRRGLVTIGGKGLDASQTDYTAILARAVQANAGIWAQELRVVTGANQIDAAHKVTGAAAAEGAGLTYALDVAALGGMYAGKIMLVGTESGLGVRNAGTLAASSGELTLDANGWLSNSGKLQAAGALGLRAAGDIANSGTVRGGTDALITGGGNIGNSGSVSAAGNLALRAEGAQSRIDAGAGSLLGSGLNADGTLGGAGALEVRATDAVTVHGSALAAGASTLAGKTLDIAGATLNAGAMALAANGGDLDLKGTHIAVAGQLDLNAAGALRTDAASVGAGQLALTAASLSNVGGDIQQSGSGDLTIRLPGQIDNTGGRIATNSASLTLDAQALANAGGTLSHAGSGAFAIKAGRIDGQGGTIVSNGKLDLATAAFDHHGASTSAGQLNIRADTLDNSGGTITQTGTGQGSIVLGQGLNNAGGTIISGGSLGVSAAALDNRQGRVNALVGVDVALGGTLDNRGGSLAGGTLALHAGDVRNAAGAIQAVSGDGTLVAGALDNTAGLVRSAGSFTLAAGMVDNHAGELSAGGDLLARLEGDFASDGLLYAGRNLSLDVTGSLDNTGSIAARGNATIAAARVHSSGLLGAGLDAQGELAGSGSLSVSAAGALATSGQNVAADGLRLQGRSLDLAASTTTASDVALAAGSGAIDTRGATVYAADTLNLKGGGLHNAGGQLSARALDIDVAALDNAGGAILQAGQGRLDLHTGALDNHGGRIAGDGTIGIHAADVNNAGGTVSGAQGLTLTAADVDNHDGQIRSALGDVTLAARDLANNDGAVFAGANLATSVRNIDNSGSLYAAGTHTLAASGSIANSGVIAAGGDAAITAGSLANSHVLGAGLSADGVLGRSGSLTVTTAGTLQSDGRNLAAGNASLTGASLDLAGSETTAANVALAAAGGGIDTGAALVSTVGTLSAAAAGTLANHGGVLSAGQLDLRVGALDNASGTILQTGSGDTAIRTGLLDNTGGRLAVNSRNLSVEADALRNAGGRLEHAGSGTLQLQAGPVDNRSGRISSSGSAAIATGAFDNTDGVASAAGGLHLNAGAIDNSGGLLRAASGTLAVDGASLLNTDGELSAGGDLRVSLAGDLRSDGLLYAGGAQNLHVGGTLDNSGAIASLGDTTIVAGSVNSNGLLGAGLDEDGAVRAGGKLNVTAGRSVASGQNLAGGDLGFKGGAIDLSHSDTTGAKVTLDAGNADLGTRGATITASGKLALNAGQVDNAGGQLEGAMVAVEAADVRNTGGEIRAGAAGMTLAVRDLDNTAGTIVAGGDLAASARSIANSGSIYAAGNQAIAASGAVHSSGVIAAQGNTTLSAASVASSGLLGAGVRADGTLTVGGDLSVTSGGALQAGGSNLAAGNASFNGATLDLSGSETGGASIHLGASAGQVDTSRALVTTTGTLAVDAQASGGLLNAGGSLSAGQLDLHASGIHNAGGTILQTGSGDTAIDTGALDNTGGRLAVNSRNLHLGADTLNNSGGRIEHAGAGTLDIAAGTLNNGAGRIISSGAAAVAATAAFDNLNGVLAAATDLRLRGGAITNGGGLLQAKTGALTLDAASFANGNGETSAGGAMQLNTSGDLGNEGLLYAGAALGLDVGGALRSKGSIAALGDTVIDAGSVQSSGLLAAGVKADGGFAGSGDLRVTSAQSLVATGQNVAAGDASLHAARIDLSGGETSAKNLTLAATAGDIDTGADALVKANGTLAITASGALHNAGGTLNAGRIALGVTSLDNRAGDIVQTGSGDLAVHLAALDNTGGRIAAAGGLDLAATTLDNTGGEIRGAGGNVTLSADTIHNGTGGSVYAAANLDTHTGTLANSGSLYAAGNQTLSASGAVDNNGTIAAQGDTSIAAASLSGDAHALLGAGMRADGSLLASGKLSVETQGLAQAHGQNLAGGDVAIRAGAIDLAGGQTGGANVSLNATSGDVLTSGDAQVSTAGTLAISASGALVNTDGILNAGQLAISAASIGNAGGTIAQSGSGDTALAAATLDNTGGWIGVNSANLRIDAAKLANAGGTIQHAGSGTLTVRAGTLDNTAGHINSAAASDVAATTALHNADGVIAGAAGLRVTGGALDNGNGLMRATNGSLVLDAASLASSGEVSAGGDLHLTVSGDLANNGLVYAGGNGTLGAGGLLQGAGSVAALGKLDVHAGRIDSSGLFGAGMRADGSLAAAGSGNLAISSSGSLKAGGDKLAAGSVVLRGAGIDLSHAYTSDAARPLTVGTNIVVDAGAGAIDTSGAVLSTAGELSLSGAALSNRHGELGGAQVGLAVASLDNAGGVIVQNGSGDMALNVATLDNSGGRITAANGSLGLTASSIDNTQGTLAAARNLRVEGGADLVNEGGKIQGVAGDVTLHVRNLRNDGGSVFAGHNLATTARDVDNGGSLFAAGSQTLAASGTVASDGVIAAQGDVTVSAASLAGGSGSLLGAGIRSDGSLGANGKLTLTTQQTLQAGGQVLAGGNAELSGAAIDLAGSQASAANMVLTAGGGNIDTHAAKLTTGTLAVTANQNGAQTWNNVGGDVQANQLQAQVANLANAAGKIVQLGSGDAVLNTSGSLDNSAGGQLAVNSANLTLRAGTLSNAGGSITHAGSGALTIEAGRFDGRDGSITGNGSLSLSAGAIDHRNGYLSAQRVAIGAATLDNSLGGKILQLGTGQGSITVTQALNNAGGRIGSNGSTTIIAASLDNTNGGQLQAGGTADLNLNVGGALANSGGSISAGGNAVLAAGSVDNRYGSATAAGAMTLNAGGQLSNTGGTLAASGDLAVTGANLDNTAGKLASVNGNLTLGSAGATTNNGGQIQAAGTVGLTNAGLANGAGGLVSGRDVNIDTRGQGLNNVQGTIAASGAANLQTGAINNDGGRVQSGGTLLVDTHGQALVNTNAGAYGAIKPGYSGGITGGTATTLYTGNLDNTGGFLAGGGQLSGSTAYLTNAGGEIAGMAGISFNTTVINNQGGSVQALGSLAFNAGGATINNYSGLLRAGQALTLNAGAIDNRATQASGYGIEGGDLTLNAASLDNGSGGVRANNNVTINSTGTVGNGGGVVSAMNSLSILDAGGSRALNIDNGGGTLIGGQMTAIRAASLGGVGRVLSQQDMSVDLAGGYALQAGSELIGNRNVTLSLGGALSNAGKLQAGGTLALNASSLDNTVSGDINAGNTRINAGSLTNRGVIDGINTDIDTGTLTNVGTGRIYGDRIGIAAGSVVNDVEGGVAGTIAARGSLALGASTISNREHALIFSGGDMAIGGGLDANRNAVGWAGSLTNASATVEALGSMNVGGSRIDVLNNHFSATAGDFGPSVVITEYFVGDAPIGPDSSAHLEMDKTVYNHYVLVTSTGRYTDYETHTTYRRTATTVVQSSDPGVFSAGANLTLNSGAILNENSQIVAGLALNVPGNVLTNRFTASKTVVRSHTTIDHREFHGALDLKPGYFDSPTNWVVDTDNPDYVIDNPSGFTFQHTPSAAPTAKTAMAGTGGISAASAATVNRLTQVAVSGPSVSTSAGTANGQLASATTGSNTASNTAHLGGAAQTGPLQGVLRDTAGTLLEGTREAGVVGSVGAVGGIGAAGPVANASGAGIDGSSASIGAIGIGTRKTAGESGTVVGADGLRSTAAIGGIGGIGGVGQPSGSSTKTNIGDRKEAGVASGVTGVTAAGSTGAIAATLNEAKVGDSVSPLPSATSLAGANGTGLAPAAGAGALGPKPGTATPNVRDIAQVPLASPSATAEVVRTSTKAPVVPNASLYQVTPAPSATYLVQTDPRFADYREWTSADYLTSKVPTDPSVTQKRLGDGFYEQQLVREQMTALTGYRYSGDYTSDEAQYRGLMDAAASFATTWNLRPGVALTPAQMAALTSDIVWLVEQDVRLADGSTQKVLVPQVYVRVREGDLDGSGALLSGKEVNIALDGDLTNSGTIAGRQVVSISAENINNLSGRIHGDDVALQARNDLNNISGSISANTSLVISAGRDINSAAGTSDITRDGWTQSLAGRVAGLYVTGNESGQGSLVAVAGGDINLSGSIVSNNATAGTSTLIAQRNLNLSAAEDSDLSADRHVQLSAGGAMTLKAGNDLNILAASSQVGALQLRAENDINNVGNNLSAENSLAASAGRDINLRTTTTSVSLGTTRAGTDSTTIDKIAGLSVTGTGAGSSLLVSAGRDINLTAAEISNAGVGGSTALSALRDLNLGTVGISARDDTIKNANNYRKENSTSEVGTVINGAGSVLLDAGNNLTVRAGQADAGTGLTLNADNDIDITTGTATYSLDQSTQTSKKGFMSKKVTTKRDTVDTVTSIASTLTGGTVSMTAGNDLNITGSAVVGDDAVKLAAGKDINIAAAIDTNSEWNHVEEKKSGFLSGGGGFGISYGTRTTTTDQTRDAVTQSGQARSMVGSIGGDLTLDAGNAIKVSGTDMSAGQDMSLAGKDVTVDAGKDKIDSKLETRVVQDALTLKVGGSIVNAIQSVQSVQQTVQATDNKRVQAMAAATAAMAVKDAQKEYAKEGFSVSLSLTAGHSESVQTTNTSETLHTGSVLTAGRDLSIVAKGEGTNANGDINVIASDINAGRNVTLAASNQVNLVAAQDLESQHSESKSMSAEAGVAASYSSKNGTAIGFTAAVSASKGHDDGEGTTQVNSTVNAGQTLTITSGGDTNIKGAIASGNQVVADVGGNLNLESLQDTAKFDSKTQSASVSGTYGYGASVSGSVNQTTIKSDYASVQEQSGIRAGDGGFQIKVGGNTDLKGAVISSTEAGTVANSLVTKTLTQSEIENHAKMEASSLGLSGSATVEGTGPAQEKGKDKVYLKDAGKTGQTAGISGIAATSSNDKSTTGSGISAGNVIVTDDAAQRGLTGQGAAQAVASTNRDVITGSDTSGSIANNFDANAVRTELSVSSAFTAAAAPMAANLVGSISQEKQTTANLQAEMYKELAGHAADDEESKAYLQKAADAEALAKSWGDDGVNRIALHTAAQGLIGLSGGSAGTLTNVAGVAGGNLGQQLGAELGRAAAAQQGLDEADTQKLINSYKESLATLGGALAGMAASSAAGNTSQNTLAGTLGAGHTANTIDVYNRQLHDDEMQLLKKLGKGKSKEEQQRLVDAACALVHCAAGTTNEQEKDRLDAQEERGEKYSVELSLLRNTGQFKYGVLGEIDDALTRAGGRIEKISNWTSNTLRWTLTGYNGSQAQTPNDLPDDSNWPKPGGGAATAVVTPSMLFCLPGMPVSMCRLTPPVGATVGSPGYTPSNALLSGDGSTGWNGNSTVEANKSTQGSAVNSENSSKQPASASDASKLSVESKLSNYLLNSEHPTGGSDKAKWFEKALGFNKSNMDELASQIVFDPKSAVMTEVTPYGTKFDQFISIEGVNGRVIEVQFSWIKNSDGIPKLVTAIPTKKR